MLGSDITSLVMMLFAAGVLAWALTGLLLRVLSGARHLALPNERSMHVAAVPVGGGIAIVATVLAMMALTRSPLPLHAMVVLACMAGLSLVSALDHYLPLWPLTRLAAQALAVTVALGLLPDSVRLIEPAPFWLERVGVGIAWLWLINLTNFMDGIDGIAGSEGAAVSLGFAAVMVWRLDLAGSVDVTMAVALAGACLGYLVWNWPPARIFMGDAGSIPIGFLFGWFLLSLAANGAWVAALVLPLLFAIDATVTLLWRLGRGEKPWRPHRNHFYQRAVQGGATPRQVVGWMTLCNLVLIVLALQSTRRPVAVIAAAVGIAVMFIVVLSQWASARKAR